MLFTLNFTKIDRLMPIIMISGADTWNQLRGFLRKTQRFVTFM